MSPKLKLWIARDTNGSTELFPDKPQRHSIGFADHATFLQAGSDIGGFPLDSTLGLKRGECKQLTFEVTK